MKTNAVRILEKASIAFELREYDVDPEDLSAITVASKVGIPIERVFKTLVCRGDRKGPLFCVVPGNKEVCLKTLAAASGERKCQVVPLKEVQPLTGYIRGGVTVLGAKKAFPVYVDASMLDFEQISVSAGTRGLQILLAPKDYVAVTGATVCEGLGRE
jgi:Cys-tRNA(Pro)/Cys-tRNA(Cys) deacylase